MSLIVFVFWPLTEDHALVDCCGGMWLVVPVRPHVPGNLPQSFDDPRKPGASMVALASCIAMLLLQFCPSCQPTTMQGFVPANRPLVSCRRLQLWRMGWRGFSWRMPVQWFCADSFGNARVCFVLKEPQPELPQFHVPNTSAIRAFHEMMMVFLCVAMWAQIICPVSSSKHVCPDWGNSCHEFKNRALQVCRGGFCCFV